MQNIIRISPQRDARNSNSLVGGSGVRLYDGPDLKLFILVSWGWSFFVSCLAHQGSTGDFLLLQIFSGVVWLAMDLQLPGNTLDLSSPRLWIFLVLFVIYLFYRDDSLTS